MNRDNVFYADLTSLVTSTVMLIAFLAFPFLSLSNLSFTALQVISISNIASSGASRAAQANNTLFSLLMFIIALASVVGIISSLIALTSRQSSKVISYINLVAGGSAFFSLIFFLSAASSDASIAGSGGFGIVVALLGLGYWILLLGSIVLAGQVFVSRQPSVMINVRPSYTPSPSPVYAQPVVPQRPQQPSRGQPANAWLIDQSNGHSYRLMRGETRIGRSAEKNHIVLSKQTVSREHARILEQGAHFMLYTSGPHPVTVNGRPMHGAYMLMRDDLLTFGDVTLKFVSGN